MTLGPQVGRGGGGRDILYDTRRHGGVTPSAAAGAGLGGAVRGSRLATCPFRRFPPLPTAAGQPGQRREGPGLRSSLPAPLVDGMDLTYCTVTCASLQYISRSPSWWG